MMVRSDNISLHANYLQCITYLHVRLYTEFLQKGSLISASSSAINQQKNQRNLYIFYILGTV